jgi:hypothetical protein
MLKHLLVGAVAALAFSAPASAQSSKDIVGTWDYGYYALIVTRADAAKFASNNRMQGTPEENKAIVQASISHFGKYTVNEADKTITFQVKTS